MTKEDTIEEVILEHQDLCGVVDYKDLAESIKQHINKYYFRKIDDRAIKEIREIDLPKTPLEELLNGHRVKVSDVSYPEASMVIADSNKWLAERIKQHYLGRLPKEKKIWWVSVTETSYFIEGKEVDYKSYCKQEAINEFLADVRKVIGEEQ